MASRQRRALSLGLLLVFLLSLAALPNLGGKWKGKTSQNLPILFKLKKDRTVRVLKFRYFISTPFGIACTYRIRMKNPAIPIDPDGTFDVEITVAGNIGSIDATFSGSFNSRTRRGDGTWDGGSYRVFCGSNTIIGGSAAPDYSYDVKKKKKKKTLVASAAETSAEEPATHEALDRERGESLQVWVGLEGPGAAVFARKLDVTGRPITAVTRLGDAGGFDPVVVFNPDRQVFLVTYSDGIDNFVQVVDREGDLSGPPAQLGAARPIIEAEIVVERMERVDR